MGNELERKLVELAQRMDYIKTTVAGPSSRSMPTVMDIQSFRTKTVIWCVRCWLDDG